MRIRARLIMSAAASILALASATASRAQSKAPAAEAAQVDEVVVTAQKREQNLQEVPAAVSAFGAAALEAQSVQSLTDLSAKAPNVVLAPVGAYPYASAFYIRGLGFADIESTSEPAVGVEMNGVYLARNSGALQDFFDVESVEILRGPQGTLYGRNAIGGVVGVRTKQAHPGDPFSGQVQATVGDHGRQELRAALNIPVSDKVAVRVSGLYKDYDGYYDNATLKQRQGDNETLSGRMTVSFKPNEVFDGALVVDGDRERGSGAAFRNASLPGNVYYNFSPDTGTSTPLYPANGSNPKDPYTVYGNTPTFANVDTWGLALTANWHTDLGTVTSITGYREFDDSVQSDYDGSAVNFFWARRDQTHEQFSQELRIASAGETKLDYVAGAFFLHQSYDITNQQGGSIYGAATPAQIAGQKNTAYALFGQLEYHVTGALTLTAGGRYSYEKKAFTNQPLFYTTSRTYRDKWSNFSPKFGANYQISDTLMAYASWSRGFRSGGYNGRAATFTSAGPYDAETVDSLEAGVKSELFQRRLRLNGAVFHSIYKNMQVTTQGLTSAGVYESIVTNAGKSKFDGAEADAQWVVGGGWRLNANIAYLDARYVRNLTDLTSDGVDNPTDNSDLPLAYAPKWSGSVGVNYSHDLNIGTFTFAANAVYMDDIYTSGGVLNRTSNVQVRPANTLYDANIALEGRNGWRVALWGKNLTDKAVINNTFGLGALGNLRVYQPPRTWGLDLSYRF